ncbi:hypothetical protein H4S07_006884, partial [Coemansia furcata]
MLLEPEPLDARKRVAMKRHKTPVEHAQPEYFDIARSFAAFDFIEYERFKSYIDTHGSISAFAVDTARLGGSNSLAQIKLDGRPIFNHDPQPPPFATTSTSPIARSSRTSTAHAASCDLASAPRISSNHRHPKPASSEARSNNGPTYPLPPIPTTQLPQWAIGALIPSHSNSVVANSNNTSTSASTTTTTSTPV